MRPIEDASKVRPRTPRGARRAIAALAAGLLPWLMACGSGSAPPPEPGTSAGVIPNLTGVTVMVFPVQILQGLPGTADAELAFALDERGGGVRWILPEELRASLRSSPALPARLRELPVDIFLRAEVRRVGDPLYGIIRRLAAFHDAAAALVPVRARYRPPTDSLPGAAEVAAALLDVSSGQVLWYGVVEGRTGPPADPRVLASALDALAKRLVPETGG